MEDLSEDPDLRIAEGSWWPRGRKKKCQRVLRPFFRPRKWKMGGCSFFERRSPTLFFSEKEIPHPLLLPSFFGRISPISPSFVLRRKTSHPAFFRPIIDPFFGTECRRCGGSMIFGSEDRGLKMEGFSDLRLRRSKMGGLRSSDSKNEEKREFFEEPLPSSKNPPFFLRSSGPKIEEPPPSSIFRAEDWVEDRRGSRGEYLSELLTVLVEVRTCRFQNPNIPRADRVGAHGGAAGRGRSGLDAGVECRSRSSTDFQGGTSV